MLRISTGDLGNVVTLNLQGKIVIGETESLRKTVGCHPGASAIVLDLAKVTTIDAHGLGVLLELRQHAESSGIEFRLMNVTRLVGRVLEITRLNSVFKVNTQKDILPRVPFGHWSSRRELRACA
jgi:anti-anti-sigma factor